MSDPYKTLGVERSASAEDIKRAYRKLAKRLHPDLNPGDTKVEQQFKEVSQAYSILSDAEKRKKFDRGEIDASGQDTGWGDRGFYRRYAESGDGAKYSHFKFGGDGDVGDIFADLFGQGGRTKAGGTRRRTVRRRGADVTYKLDVDFADAAAGAKKRIVLADGRALDVTIPSGTEDGQTLRLKGKGMDGLGGAPAGDAYIEIHIQPHAFFTREGNDIRMELPISLQEAVLGASVEVPTLHGKVTMKIPAGSNSGGTLRLKGKGVANRKTGDQGDQYLTLRVVLPDKPDKELQSFVEQWAGDHDYNPRRKAGLE